MVERVSRFKIYPSSYSSLLFLLSRRSDNYRLIQGKPASVELGESFGFNKPHYSSGDSPKDETYISSQQFWSTSRKQTAWDKLFVSAYLLQSYFPPIQNQSKFQLHCVQFIILISTLSRFFRKNCFLSSYHKPIIASNVSYSFSRLLHDWGLLS